MFLDTDLTTDKITISSLVHVPCVKGPYEVFIILCSIPMISLIQSVSYNGFIKTQSIKGESILNFMNKVQHKTQHKMFQFV